METRLSQREHNLRLVGRVVGVRKLRQHSGALNHHLFTMLKPSRCHLNLRSPDTKEPRDSERLFLKPPNFYNNVLGKKKNQMDSRPGPRRALQSRRRVMQSTVVQTTLCHPTFVTGQRSTPRRQTEQVARRTPTRIRCSVSLNCAAMS